jgi:cell filamentation protein
LRHIHERIFGELYDWAGRWRTVTISKGTMMWPPPTFLDQAMQEFEREVLKKFPAGAVQSDEAFCAAAGEIQGEFLAVHPFREGNARTIKLLTDLLAAQTGRPLLVYDDTERGRDRYIEAARAAIRKDYQPMTAIIRDALLAAKQPLRAGPGSAGGSPPGMAEAPQ